MEACFSFTCVMTSTSQVCRVPLATPGRQPAKVRMLLRSPAAGVELKSHRVIDLRCAHQERGKLRPCDSGRVETRTMLLWMAWAHSATTTSRTGTPIPRRRMDPPAHRVPMRLRGHLWEAAGELMRYCPRCQQLSIHRSHSCLPQQALTAPVAARSHSAVHRQQAAAALLALVRPWAAAGGPPHLRPPCPRHCWSPSCRQSRCLRMTAAHE